MMAFDGTGYKAIYINQAMKLTGRVLMATSMMGLSVESGFHSNSAWCTHPWPPRPNAIQSLPAKASCTFEEVQASHIGIDHGFPAAAPMSEQNNCNVASATSAICQLSFCMGNSAWGLPSSTKLVLPCQYCTRRDESCDDMCHKGGAFTLVASWNTLQMTKHL